MNTPNSEGSDNVVTDMAIVNSVMSKTMFDSDAYILSFLENLLEF